MLITSVARAAPFHCATEKLSKPPPEIVTVAPLLPARTLFGETDVANGQRMRYGTSDASALNTRARGTIVPDPKNRSSAIGRPVCRSAVRMVLTLAAGAA